MKNIILILWVLIFAVFISACDNYGELVEKNKGEVYYKDPITKQQAESLANYLYEIGYFDGNEKSVQLLKDGDNFTVNFVVKQGAADKKENVDLFKSFSPLLSYGVFDGALVNIAMCDDHFKTLKFIPGFNYGKLMRFGDDELYYTKEIDKQTAKKLGEFLRESKFFQSKGLQVQITKKGDVYQFKYVIKEGADKDDSYKATVGAFGQLISQNVFDNQRVDMHLCDDNFNTLATVVGK